jgi:phage/plasmid-like protein (TIGR03299 family)
MSHNIDMSNDRANIAFLGSRNDVWHRLGHEMASGMTIDQWAAAAGLNWSAIKVPAIASLSGADFDHIEPSKRFVEVDNKRFIVRSDTGSVLGIGSDQYQPHQPAEVLDWFQRYISVDDRFALDVAGSLRGGAIIWATALFNGGLDIGGDKHVARVLMTTTFDATGSTINKMTTTRVVCNNTLDVALADNRATIRTTHRSKFDAGRVGRELAALAQGVASYKAVGDALAANEMGRDQVSSFFKQCLDIPFEAKRDDVSSRKLNQFEALNQAYQTTAREGSTGNAWAALQAITRYVDHDRSSRGGDDATESRFHSAQFGSGAALKGKAMDLLLPRIKDKVSVAA